MAPQEKFLNLKSKYRGKKEFYFYDKMVPQPPIPTPIPVPTQLYIYDLPLFSGVDYNGCYTYNDIAYIDYYPLTSPPVYRTGSNNKTSLNYATYTFDNDPTQILLSSYNIANQPTISSVGYGFFNINDVGISGFTNGQSLGNSYIGVLAVNNLSQATNGVYFPKLGTFTETWGTYTITDTCS